MMGGSSLSVSDGRRAGRTGIPGLGPDARTGLASPSAAIGDRGDVPIVHPRSRCAGVVVSLTLRLRLRFPKKLKLSKLICERANLESRLVEPGAEGPVGIGTCDVGRLGAGPGAGDAELEDEI